MPLPVIRRSEASIIISATTGERLSGLFFVEGKYLYFKENGAQCTRQGFRTISQKRYYLSKSGVIKDGFFKVGKDQYYQTAVTGVVTGEQEINGKKYFFKSNGVYDEELTKRMRESTALGNPSDHFVLYEI